MWESLAHEIYKKLPQLIKKGNQMNKSEKSKNSQFTGKDTQVANDHVERCSNSLVIRRK